MVLPPTSDDLARDDARPYFLWWTECTVADLRAHLASADLEEAGYWLGALLREANTRDVWLFTTPDAVRAQWPQVLRHLGRARERWAWLLGLDATSGALTADPPNPGYHPVVSASARTIQIPVSLPWDRGGEPDVPTLGRELRLLWLIEEVRQRRLGTGKGSELAGMARAAFMRLLGEHGVPVIDYSVEELERELRVLGVE